MLESVSELNQLHEKEFEDPDIDTRVTQYEMAYLPALPLFIERLPAPSDKLTAEVLDILTGFAVTTDPVRAEQYQQALGRKALPQPSWVVEVRSRLRAELDRIAALTTHQNAEVAECAKRIIEELS